MEAISRPVPRRTYGRAVPRPTSPDLDNDHETASRPTTSALFFPLATESPSNSTPTTIAAISPSKALVNRFATSAASWRLSLADLDVDRPTNNVLDTDDSNNTDMLKYRPTQLGDGSVMEKKIASSQESVDVDDDEVREVMERMRRQMRGEVVPILRSDNVQIVGNLNGPSINRQLVNASSSSTLSAAPTSPLPSSPPLQTKSFTSNDGETVPIRKVGSRPSSRAAKRIITSDDEDEDEQGGDNNNKDDDSAGFHTSKAESRLFSRSPTVMSDRGPRVKDFFDRLADEDKDSESEAEKEDEKAIEKEKRSDMGQSLESIADPVTLFDENDSHDLQSKIATKKNKALNKKDQVELQRDIARAHREKPIALAKPEHARRLMTDWVKMAQSFITNDEKTPENPGLLRDDKSPATSPTTLTPADEIDQFTPSSAANARSKLKSSIHSSNALDGQTSSSPTPATRRSGVNSRSKVVVPGTSDSEDEEDSQVFSVATIIQKTNQKDCEAAQLAERCKRLEARKALALKSRLSTLPFVKSRVEEDENEDDFIIEPLEVKSVQDVTTKRPGLKDAVTMLKDRTTGPVITKNRQVFAQRAGNAKGKTITNSTESYVDFAGKTFAHHSVKEKNGVAKPAGQKKGRDTAMTQAQLDAFILNQHLKQVKDVAAKKELNFGKGRVLPSKQPLELSLPSSSNQLGEEGKGAGSDDDDRDDGDFVGDDEHSTIDYSGASEDEEAGQAEGDDKEGENQLVNEQDDLKENVTPLLSSTSLNLDLDEEDEDILAFRRRRPRPSARVAFDSDDEQEESSKIKNNNTSSNSFQAFGPSKSDESTGKTVESTGIDFPGFGDGSQGFSQLFDETQAAGDISNGFDAIRAEEPNGLFPDFALLPEVNISKTQIERDNALIAGEVEMARAEMVNSTAPKQQYLNSQGFFTQTKPRELDATQLTDDEEGGKFSQLGGYSTVVDIPLDPTDINNSTSLYDAAFASTSSPGESILPLSYNNKNNLDVTISPTQHTQTLTRLIRRTSPVLNMSPTQPGTSSAQSDSVPHHAANAFDVLRLGARRAERKEKARAKKPFNSELVDEQAEESDEDNAWGIMGGDEEEEEEGEDEGYVPDLLNDEEISEEERKRLADLAAEKHREIQAADDAKREAEAKKLTEGAYRNKRRGNAFLSDDEDEEDEDGRRRRLSKKQRRARKLDREDGLNKLEGEENAFRRTYDEDLESDNDFEETPLSPSLDRSTSPDYLTSRERHEMLRERARMNTEIDMEMQGRLLDRYIGMDYHTSESSFSISRTVRHTVSLTQTNVDTIGFGQRQKSNNTLRSTESFAKFISDESINPRRTGISNGAVSVVYNGNNNANSKNNSLRSTSSSSLKTPLLHNAAAAGERSRIGKNVAGAGSGKSMGRQASVLMTKKAGFM